ncbi:hypothetical protein GQX74_003575 [Glossina fuscipes]|nr:hypothetical protein GQX74_003575 [Glossina fuscipes]
MVDSYVAPLVITCIWAFVGIICPFFARGPSKGWLCCYMTQMNPLIGPKLSRNEIMIIAKEWGHEIKNVIDTNNPKPMSSSSSSDSSFSSFFSSTGATTVTGAADTANLLGSFMYSLMVAASLNSISVVAAIATAKLATPAWNFARKSSGLISKISGENIEPES